MGRTKHDFRAERAPVNAEGRRYVRTCVCGKPPVAWELKVETGRHPFLPDTPAAQSLKKLEVEAKTLESFELNGSGFFYGSWPFRRSFRCIEPRGGGGGKMTNITPFFEFVMVLVVPGALVILLVLP
jgi:hypothetical protein